eukprot:UN15609
MLIPFCNLKVYYINFCLHKILKKIFMHCRSFQSDMTR